MGILANASSREAMRAGSSPAAPGYATTAGLPPGPAVSPLVVSRFFDGKRSPRS
jgi:hypothetical protein